MRRLSGREVARPMNGNGKRPEVLPPLGRLAATEDEKAEYIRQLRAREGRCVTCGCRPVGQFGPLVDGACTRCRTTAPKRRKGDG